MSAHQHGHHHGGSRGRRFDAARAARLDEPERFTYLPPATLVQFLDAPTGATVLDFGTGTGTYAIAFAQARPDCRVVGIDVQPEMLALLRAKPDAARVRSGGPELLAELTGSIDRVLALNVLHELEEQHLRELFAALAPGARVAVVDWNADVERPSGPPAAHLYGPADASRHLAAFGFVLERELMLPYHYALYGRIEASAAPKP
jgi:SAM-dependent methyltransferase